MVVHVLMCFHSKWWIPVESYRPSPETKHGMSFDTAQKIASAAEKQAHVSGEFQWRCCPGTSINKCKPFLEKIHGKIMSCSLHGLTSQALPLPPLVQPSDQVCLFVCVCVSLWQQERGGGRWPPPAPWESLEPGQAQRKPQWGGWRLLKHSLWRKMKYFGMPVVHDGLIQDVQALKCQVFPVVTVRWAQRIPRKERCFTVSSRSCKTGFFRWPFFLSFFPPMAARWKSAAMVMKIMMQMETPMPLSMAVVMPEAKAYMVSSSESWASWTTIVEAKAYMASSHPTVRAVVLGDNNDNLGQGFFVTLQTETHWTQLSPQDLGPFSPPTKHPSWKKPRKTVPRKFVNMQRGHCKHQPVSTTWVDVCHPQRFRTSICFIVTQTWRIMEVRQSFLNQPSFNDIEV